VAFSGTTNTVWVADTKNNRFLEFSPDGVATGRAFGKFGSGTGQFNWPFALVAAGSDIIVADTKNHRVQRWNPGTHTLVWSASAGFRHPKDLDLREDVLYVADSENKRVVRLRASDGTFIDSLSNSDLHRVEGVAVEPNGDIWVADTSWNRLVELSSTGATLQKIGKFGSDNSSFNQPAHLKIRVTESGTFLYVADVWNDRIQVYKLSQ
jgi:DNA-binding beta-propeller fold protein YncE